MQKISPEKNYFYFADRSEMKKRKDLANEFYYAILDPEEIPYIVTDEASIYDFFAGVDEELISKVHQHYGIKMPNNYLKLEFWKVLDWLDKNRLTRK